MAIKLLIVQSGRPGPSPRKLSPDGATRAPSDKQAYYSFIDPQRMKG